jgi:transketolase
MSSSAAIDSTNQPTITENRITTNHLALAPQNAPYFGIITQKTDGSSITLGDPRATRSLVALMNSHAVIGGAACHWGGPSAFAEINSALHGILFQKSDWFNHFHYVNDAGHTENGIYALRANLGYGSFTIDELKGFRSIESRLTGHGEAHVNPEGVLLSNGPLGSSIAQAQGLAMADALSKIDRTTVVLVSDGAAMEGEAREAFASIPGFAAKKQLNPFVMIVSDNNTKLSGRIDKDSFSMHPSFAALAPLGWEIVRIENGHDLEEVLQGLEKAIRIANTNPSKPVCVWVKTIKGYGNKKTADSASGGHGFPEDAMNNMSEFLAEIWGNEALIPPFFSNWAQEIQTILADKKAKKAANTTPSAPSEKVQAGFSKGAITLAQENLPIISISSDVAGSTGIGAFQKQFPEKCFDVGIAESNMVSVAAGFSKMGYIPMVDTFAQFGVTKGNLPWIMASLSEAPIIGLFSHAGFQDAADGASHQATTHLSLMSGIPNNWVITPATSQEAEWALKESAYRIQEARKNGQAGDSVCFFVGRENFTPAHVGTPFAWGQPQILRNGKDVVLVGFGYMVAKLLKAAEILAEEGIDATVIQNAFVNRPDIEAFKPWIEAASGRLVTLEDHQITAGAGSILAQALLLDGVQIQLRSLGIQGEFGRSAYNADDLYKIHKMDVNDVVSAAKSLMA